MKILVKNRGNLGLELLKADTTMYAKPSWPGRNHGGLISHNDGRLDPIKFQQCILKAMEKYDVKKIATSVICLERALSTTKSRWYLHLDNGNSLTQDSVVICAVLGSEALLNPLGHSRPIAPILGQVLDLQLNNTQKNWSGWPAVLVSESINLIPNGSNRIWVGATLEQGTNASTTCLEKMLKMNGVAPNWLKEASIHAKWHGLRGRPVQRPPLY